MWKKLFLLVAAVVLSLPLLATGDENTLKRDIIQLRQSKTDMVRYANHSTAIQIKLNAKVDRTKFNAYSSHRQGEIAALQARPLTSGVNTGDVTIGTANGLSLAGQVLSLQAATDSVPGALTAADHASFAAKQNALTPGVDYLTPTGSAAGLTGFPTLNQNTTGSAAKLTTARNVNGVPFDGTADIQTTTAGTSDYTGATSWTPTGNGVTLTVTSAKYAVVGALVIAEATVVWPLTANTGQARISGLPFAAALSSACSVGFSNASLASFTMYVNTGTSAIYPYRLDSTQITNANMSGSSLILTCVYLK